MTCTVIGQGNAGKAPRTMGDTRPRTGRSACPNARCGAGEAGDDDEGGARNSDQADKCPGFPRRGCTKKDSRPPLHRYFNAS